MIMLTKILKSAFDSAKRRVVTAMGYNVISAVEAAPAGIDCPPIAGMLGVYVETVKRNSPVLAGYVNTDLMALPGERRISATDGNGKEVLKIWLHKDGKLEIGGTSDSVNANHAVQYEALQTAFDQLKSDFDNLVTIFNAHVHPGVTTGPGSSGPTATPGTASTADITPAKEPDILLP